MLEAVLPGVAVWCTRATRTVVLSVATLIACATEPDNTPAALDVDGFSSFTGVAGTALAERLSVRVTTSDGRTLQGVPVNFQVVRGGGSIPASAVTNASGIATAGIWVLGQVAGENAVEASVNGISQKVIFRADGEAGAPALMTVIAGDGQSGQVGSVLRTRPSVRVTDIFENPNSGVEVSFSVSAGGGSITGGLALTNAAGVATAGDWTLGTTAGANRLSVSVAGLAVEITANGTSGPATRIRGSTGAAQTAVAGTAVAEPITVKTVDAFDNGVAGIPVTFAIDFGGGSITGAQQVSDAEGKATLGSWTLGTTVGMNKLTASSPGLTSYSVFADAKAGPVATLALTPDPLQLVRGDTGRLTAGAKDSHANAIANPEVNWSSSNTTIATVSTSGLVTAHDNGTAKIIGRSGSVTDTATVTVAPQAPDVFTLQTNSITATSMWVRATIYQRGDPTKAWFEYGTNASLTGAAATSLTQLGSGVIGNERRISGLQPNTWYYYRAIAENGIGRDTGAVDSARTSPSGGRQLLRQTALSGITSRADFEVPAGTTRLEVTTEGSEAVYLFLRYGAAAEVNAADCISAHVSTVGESRLQACTFDNPRTGTWHVMLLGVYSGVTLTALGHGLVDVTVSPAVDTLGVGSTRQYTATVTGNTNTAVTWSSSNTAVATVSASGLVTAVAPGQSTITARSVADVNRTATASLTVLQNHVAVSLDRANDTLQVTATRQLTATVTGTSNTAVTWSAVNTQVATVSASGLVTAVWKGSTQVKATSVADPAKVATVNVAVTVPLMTVGTPLTGLSGLENSIRYYEITVPDGSPLVAVRSATDSGNVDLWLARGSRPGGSTANCTIEGSTGNEVCEVNKATFITGSQFHGDWYVAVVGKSDYAISGRTDYKNVTLTATTDSTSSVGVQVLQNDVPLTALTGVKDQLNSYKIYVPAGKASLEIKATGGVGKIFLLSQWRRMVDKRAGTSGYSCKQEAIDNEFVATCLYNNPTAGWYYIMLDGFNGYSGFTLRAKYP